MGAYYAALSPLPGNSPPSVPTLDQYAKPRHDVSLTFTWSDSLLILLLVSMLEICDLARSVLYQGCASHTSRSQRPHIERRDNLSSLESGRTQILKDVKAVQAEPLNRGKCN